MHQHQDIHGRYINIGDYVVFPAPGYGSGSGMAPLKLGEVIDLTKGGVRVRYIDKNWDYEQQAVGHYETTNIPLTNYQGYPMVDYNGNPRYERKWVIDRYEEKQPVLIKATTDRFFVVSKP